MSDKARFRSQSDLRIRTAVIASKGAHQTSAFGGRLGLPDEGQKWDAPALIYLVTSCSAYKATCPDHVGAIQFPI
jgi:hypothetical protein